MKLLVLAVLLTVAAAASAQKRCCAPDQFMATNGMTVGVAGPDGGEAYGISQYGAFDFRNKRFGFNQSVFFYHNYTFFNIRVIQNYAERAQWFILDEYEYCDKQPLLAAEPDNCLPATATKFPGGSLGGKKGIYMDSYQYFVSPPKYPYQGSAIYSGVQESCFPIGSTFVGKTFQGETGLDTVSVGGLLNVTIGIHDPDEWFKLPPFCHDEVADMNCRHPKFMPDIKYLTQFPVLY